MLRWQEKPCNRGAVARPVAAVAEERWQPVGDSHPPGAPVAVAEGRRWRGDEDSCERRAVRDVTPRDDPR